MKTRPTFNDFGLTLDGSADPNLEHLNPEQLIDLFKQHGLLLFSGFHVDTDNFERFTNEFSSDYMDNRGGGSLREVINKDGDKTILSVSYSYDANKASFDNEGQRVFPLALHSDRSYTKSQPPVMWFYCATPASSDGETTVCDGAEVYKQLGESTRRFLKENPIKYIRTYTDNEWQLWAQTDSLDAVTKYCRDNELTLTVNEDNSVTTESIKMAVVKTRWGERDAFVNSILLVLWQEDELGTSRSIVRMADGSKIPADILDEVREVTEALTRDIAWNSGEIAMIDNTRVLHGRRMFSDPKRSIYVRMCRSVAW